ncbi:hypothetical protein [Escherichia phage OLB35]|uniref:Uncharacterized protein n=1 Tax=Escherichia phage OLB35 TaxID=2448911 RepID=A0A3G3MCX7_9CAUD|nr:hypothetical protein [Escherichia phage OLB35]
MGFAFGLVGFLIDGVVYASQMISYNELLAKRENETIEAVKKYEYEEAMEFVKEIRCKSLN